MNLSMTSITQLKRLDTLLPFWAAAMLLVFAPSVRGQQPGEPYRTEAPLPSSSAATQFPTNDSLSPLPPIEPSPFSSPAMQSPLTPWPSAPPAAPQSVLNDSDPRRVPARLASFPRDATEPLLDQPNNFVLIPESQQPNLPPQRAGMFQRISATTTYLPRLDENNSVGFEDTEVYAVFGVPCPTRDSPLLIEPGTDFWVVDAPHFNLPPTVHDDYVEFHWLGKLNDRWGADLMVTPGWHSDYQNADGAQAFRLESHAVVVYTLSDDLKIAVGAAYWGRLNANVVPAGGVIWTPNADTRFELITPKPRIAYRVDCSPTYERWAYIAGEFGGGQWAIQQTGGVENELNYSDYRIMLGVEHKSLDLGLNGFAEIGYVFGRQLQYQYLLPDQTLPTTMMVRVGVSY
jgi:hypothetical protein